MQWKNDSELFTLTRRNLYTAVVGDINPNGPISTIASAHTMATVPNFFRQEFMLKDVP